MESKGEDGEREGKKAHNVEIRLVDNLESIRVSQGIAKTLRRQTHLLADHFLNHVLERDDTDGSSSLSGSLQERDKSQHSGIFVER